MTYELCNQLRDAGFPQMGDGFALIADKELPESEPTMTVIPWCLYVVRSDLRKKALYSPTLSELIAACVPNFSSLNMMPRGSFHQGDDLWLAFDTFSERTEGKTPEEAVAKLWLALNKRDG